MMKDDDFKLLRGFDYGRTDGQTFVIVESLLRLKEEFSNPNKNSDCELQNPFDQFSFIQ